MRTYFKFLSRNKLYTAIEVFGLSVALGFVIILASYARMEYGVGKNVKDADSIYAVGMGNYLGLTWGTPQEFFPSVPEIREWTRYAQLQHIEGVMIGEQYYKTNVFTIDPNFFQMFDYELRGCRRERVLTNENEAIVSESFAAKAFGKDNPIGKTIKIKPSMGYGSFEDATLKVVGVAQDFGSSDVFHPYGIMVSMKYKEKLLAKMDNFGEVVPFVRLAKGSDPDKVAAKLLDKYVAYWDFYKREGSFLWGSALVRFDKIYFSDNTCFLFRHGDKTLVNILFVVALVLLISAILNYINLTVAQAGKRAKEMATRRLLGESVMGIVGRYFKESAVFTFFCFLVGLLLAFAMLPMFNDILNTKISPDISVSTVIWTIVALLAMSLVCGIVPAAVVSRFNPIDVVKGSLNLKNKMWFSKAFIIAQGIVSTVLIAVGMAMTLQIHHLATLPMGYNTEDIIHAHTGTIGFTLDRQNILAERLKALPEVEEAVPNGGIPFLCPANGVHDTNGKGSEEFLRMSQLDSTSMKMLDIKIIERYCEPTEGKLWVTETAKRHFNVSAEHPTIGVHNSKPEYECCGVIADYHNGSAVMEELDIKTYNVIRVPMRDGYYMFMLIKIHGDHDKALAAVRKTCAEVAKEVTGMPLDLECNYLDDYLADSLKSRRNTMTLVLTFMFVSILISALGMFAMSVYFSEQQRRQIALRKVMGATTRNAVWTLSRRFLVMAVVSIVIASPVSVKLIMRYLQDFPIRIPFPWWVIPVAAVFTLVIAFASVISRTLKVATSNPIESIKTE